MRKIPTLFVRDPDNMRQVLPEVTPGCEWVLAGEGVPTRKYDGTCVMLSADEDRWWARREVKPGKSAPPGFLAISRDLETGKTVGWEPIEQSPFARFHALALTTPPLEGFEPGTYELCGAKINGNPENVDGHVLIRHGEVVLPPEVPRDFGSLQAWLTAPEVEGMEGIVWWRDLSDPGCDKAKLKRRDFA